MNRVLLHPIKICHINFMLQLVNDPEVTRYLPALIQDEKLMETWINNLRPEDHEYIISLNNGISIGECSLSVYDKTAEIGLMMLRQYWNHGYGSETVRMLMPCLTEISPWQDPASPGFHPPKDKGTSANMVAGVTTFSSKAGE